MDTIKIWWPIVATAMNFTFMLAGWALHKTFVKTEDFSKLKDSHTALLTRVEALPSHGEMSELRLSIEELRGEIKAIAPALRGLEHISNLLLENELKERA